MLQIAYCLGAIAVGIALNAASNRILPTDFVDGSPRWMWYHTQAFQLMVAPALVCWAWAGHSFALGWLTLPRASLALRERVLVRAFVGFFAKDLTEDQQPLYHMHHVVCAAMCFGALLVPRAGPMVLAGAAVLEFGSGFFGQTRLFPGSSRTWNLYLVMMSLSNVVTALMVLQMQQIEALPLVVKCAYTVLVVIMIGMRQETAVREWRNARKGGAAAKERV